MPTTPASVTTASSQPECEQALTWSNARQTARDKAVKLRNVFLPFLERAANEDRTQTQLETDLIAAYNREFGHQVSGRWLRELYRRFLKNDCGRAEFLRLELYLLDSAAPSRSKRSSQPDFNHDDLSAAIKSILARPGSDAAHLTQPQKEYIWTAAWNHVNNLAPIGNKHHEAAKQAVRQYIWQTLPMLAGSQDALKRNMNRKFAALAEHNGKPSSIIDRREFHSGWQRGPEISEKTENAIIAHSTFNHGSRLAPAWRDYRAGRIPGIEPEKHLIDYYGESTGKSDVPSRIRDAVKHKMPAMKILHRGPYQYAQTGWIPLADEKTFAGEIWSSDDFTMPVYFLAPEFVTVANEVDLEIQIEGNRVLMRGQVLLTVDRRSRKILGYCLIPQRNYNSVQVLSHFINTADYYGLPQWAEWERGLWQRSKLLKGDSQADSVPIEERELGLLELGVKFRHRGSPKAKIVERVGGALQNLMEGEPGYCGRNEQTERHEYFVKLKQDAVAGRIDSFKHFYAFEMWHSRLGEICDKYNQEPQGRGTLLDGLSPEQAYEKFQNHDDPPVKLDASTRYLLATHRRVSKGAGNGFLFRNGADYWYRGGRSGEFVNQKMLLWFSAQDPSIAYVTDLKRQNPFAVELGEKLHPVNESSEKLSNELRKLREHQRPMKALYNTLKVQFPLLSRKTIAAPQIIETGRAFQEAAQEIKETRKQRNSVHRRAAAAGVVINHPIRNPDRVMRGIELLSQTGPQASLDSPAPKKVYILDPSPASKPSPSLYWALWGKVEKTKPGLSRHALTQKALGCHPKPQEMTSDQLSKMIEVFSAIIRDANAAIPT